METLYDYLKESHAVNEVQMAFADMVVRRAEQTNDNDALKVLAAVTVAVTAQSHSCLDVSAWCDQLLKDLKAQAEDKQLVKPEQLASWLDDWQTRCRALQSTALAHLDSDTDAIGDAPLIMRIDGNRTLVYLNRFYGYENNIGKTIIERVQHADSQHSKDDPTALQSEVHEACSYFAAKKFADDAQQQAVYNALQSSFSIVTGGPGRGKTTVLAVILALRLKHWQAEHPDAPMKIALCAPTGKAAGRMKQAIDNAISGNTLNQVVIGDKACEQLSELRSQTIHSLLKIHEDSDYPKANAQSPLDYDLVAVDECSMMSLQLFSQLLSALNPETRLILLGDENQLASVDTGNVLFELCHSNALADHASPKIINRLTFNYRSKDNPALCAYTDELVKEPACPDVEALFKGLDTKFRAIETAANHPEKQLEKLLAEALQKADILKGPDDGKNNPWRKAKNVDEAFAFMDKFKILSPVREGRYGVIRLNALMRKLLDMRDDYANGVPVIVTRNDAVTGLKNGDVGICFNQMVFFKLLKADGTEMTCSYSPAQLPPHECAFAMTIHKSQGSDYENVFMLLPEKDNPVLTRELVYTGITRTKKIFTLLAPRQLLEKAQVRKTDRWSGLQSKLS